MAANNELDRNSYEDWERFAELMIEKTKAGRIDWTDLRRLRSQEVSRPGLIGPIFYTKFGSRPYEIAVYRYEYPYSVDEVRDEMRTETAIEFVDSDGMPSWTLPQVPSRRELYDLLQFETAEAAEAFLTLQDA